MKYEKAKVALEKQTRRRTRQILDTKTGQWEWTVTRRHPKEVKYWGQYAKKFILNSCKYFHVGNLNIFFFICIM